MKPFLCTPFLWWGRIKFGGLFQIFQNAIHFCEPIRLRWGAVSRQSFRINPRLKKSVIEWNIEFCCVVVFYESNEPFSVHCFECIFWKVIFYKRVKLVAAEFLFNGAKKVITFIVGYIGNAIIWISPGKIEFQSCVFCQTFFVKRFYFPIQILQI